MSSLLLQTLLLYAYRLWYIYIHAYVLVWFILSPINPIIMPHYYGRT